MREHDLTIADPEADAPQFEGGESATSIRSTSTERVRAFRERQRKAGSSVSSLVLSSKAAAAIQMLQLFHGQAQKVRVIEGALLKEARRCLDEEGRLQEMVASARISEELAHSWRTILQDGAEDQFIGQPGRPNSEASR